MEIKVIENEKIDYSKRADEIHFIDVKVNKVNDVDKEFAEKFVRDILSYNFTLEFTTDTWEYIKELFIDKLEKMKKPNGFNSNDGTILPLFANYILEKIFNVELLSYSENLDDIQSAPNGFDAIFLDSDLSIFLCEYKTTIQTINEEKISNKVIEGYRSVFCTESFVISKIHSISSKIKDRANKDIIRNNLKKLIMNRRELEKLCGTKDTKFNICCVTKSNKELDLKKIVENVDNKFIQDKYCRNSNSKMCSKIGNCNKIDKIKVINIVIIRIPENLNFKNFYLNVVKKIEDLIDGK